jgi:colicin import membrane protein
MAVLTEARADARSRAERAERHADALAAQLEARADLRDGVST